MLYTSFAFSQVLDDTAINLTFSGRVNEAKATAIPSNGTVYLSSANGNLVHVTGTTTITSFGPAVQAGIKRLVIFDGVLTLTHSGTTLALPGSANITTAAGDMATVVADSTTKWIVKDYVRATGASLFNSGLKTAQVAISSSTVLVATDVIQSGLFVDAVNGAISSQLPLGADLATAYPGYQVGTTFEFTVVNTGNNTHTLTVNTGSTIVGLATIATLTSGTCVCRFSAANTVICYRK